MSGSPTLATLLWPVDRLSQALAACGGEPVDPDAPAGSGGHGWEALMDGRGGNLREIEVEPVEVPWPEAGRALRSLAPAVLQLEEPNAGQLVLLRGGGRRVVALGPDGRRHRLRAARLAAELVRGIAEPLAAKVDGLLRDLVLTPRRRRRARRALLAAQLAARPGLRAQVVTHRAGLLRRDAGLVRPIAAWLAAVAAWQALALASWALLGRGVLDGGLESGWLAAWALLLATLAVVQAGELAAVAAAGQRAARWLRQLLFAALLALEPDRLRGEGVGRLLGRLLAAETLERALLATGAAVLVAAAELAGAVAALAHGACARVHPALLALAVASALLLASKHQRVQGACVAAELERTDRMVEAVAGHRTRRVEGGKHLAAGEDAALAGYHLLVGDAGRWERWLRTALPRLWLLAGLAALAVVGGEVAPGRMAVSLGGLLLARAGLGRLGLALCELSRGRVAAREVLPLLGGRHGRAAPADRGAAGGEAILAAARRGAACLIEARALECRVPGGLRPVVAAANLEIRPGERVRIDGPSGAGKSTLASVLAGHRQPASGLLLLWGLDRATLGTAGWRRRVVAVPQLHENHLFADTLAFNLLLGRGWPPAAGDLVEAAAVCRELGLGGLLEGLPAGLEQRIGEAGLQLSDGEASRVCLGRALLQGADLLILDESLAALDPETRLRVIEVVKRRAGAVVLIAHGEPVGDFGGETGGDP